jgi:hypothetical protein
MQPSHQTSPRKSEATHRRRIILIVAFLGVFIALASLFTARALPQWPRRQFALPLEKQLIQDRYDQERLDGYQNPANKDEIPTPLPETPAPYPTGIFENTQPPYPAIDFTSKNMWQGVIGGNRVAVFAGAEGYEGNTRQGLLIVQVDDPQASQMDVTRHPTPHIAGPIRIESVNGMIMHLSSTEGATYSFDLSTRKYIQSIFVPNVSR